MSCRVGSDRGAYALSCSRERYPAEGLEDVPEPREPVSRPVQKSNHRPESTTPSHGIEYRTGLKRAYGRSSSKLRHHRSARCRVRPESMSFRDGSNIL